MTMTATLQPPVPKWNGGGGISPNGKIVKDTNRLLPNICNSVHQLSSRASSAKPSVVSNDSDLQTFGLNREDSAGAQRFHNIVARAQGAKPEIVVTTPRFGASVNQAIILQNALNKTRKFSTVSKSDRETVTSVKTPKITLDFSSNKQYTYKDVIVQLYRIWEPQLSDSYRPFVKYIPKMEEDGPLESGVSETVDGQRTEHHLLRTLKAASTAVEIASFVSGRRSMVSITK